MSTIECKDCGVVMTRPIPLSELREDAKNIGWEGLKCPDCVAEEDELV